jgi:hypothetical protein
MGCPGQTARACYCPLVHDPGMPQARIIHDRGASVPRPRGEQAPDDVDADPGTFDGEGDPDHLSQSEQ